MKCLSLVQDTTGTTGTTWTTSGSQRTALAGLHWPFLALYGLPVPFAQMDLSPKLHDSVGTVRHAFPFKSQSHKNFVAFFQHVQMETQSLAGSLSHVVTTLLTSH